MRGISRRQIGGGLALTLSGCAPGNFLAESGPTRGAVIDGAARTTRTALEPPRATYALVQVNETVLAQMTRIEPVASFAVDNRAVPLGAIGVGDVIGLTIFESDSGGLFLPREPGTRAGNYVTLPNQEVDRNGDISVPYAGKLRASGLTPSVLKTSIEEKLASRAVEPQVVVSIIERRAKAVNVLGELVKAANFTLDPAGETVLGAITRAGGPKYPAYESVVTLQRAGRTYRTRLSDIARNPRQNVPVWPGDTIYVSHEPRYFVAMGATGQAGSLGPVDRRISFQDNQLTLADAIGRAGGLEDTRANARGVFVYRFEPRGTIASYGMAATNALPPIVPTIYLFDLTDPAGFFHASRFQIHSQDVVYVANAPATDLQKFLSLMIGTTGSSAAIRATVN